MAELVSNSLRRAFPENREGRVTVSLSSIQEREYELTIADNCVAIAREDTESPDSVEMELIRTFVAQLHGQIEVNRVGGTLVRVRFREIAHESDE